MNSLHTLWTTTGPTAMSTLPSSRRRLGSWIVSAGLAVTAGTVTLVSTCVCEQDETKNMAIESPSRPRDRIIFLGTGSSTGCPKPLCTMLFGLTAATTTTTTSSATKAISSSDTVLEAMRKEFLGKCNVSNKAILGNPVDNKDYRNNPSLLIAQYDEHDKRMKHIIIDVGKTFREASLRWFPVHGIDTLDAVILTHEHADASFGLDDIRGYQRVSKFRGKSGFPETIPMKVYLSRPCLNTLSPMFPWLFPAQQPRGIRDPTQPEVKRFVSKLDLHLFDSFDSLDVEGLSVVPLPVMHGEDFLSYGFAFTCGKTNIVYLSDISRMLPETMDFIHHKLPPTDILIVDSLYPQGTHPVHYSMAQAITVVNQIKPKQTYIVGINCDAFLPHDEMNKELRRRYGNLQLAHDGLCIEC